MGVSASINEKLNTLVPKVLNIQSSGNISQGQSIPDNNSGNNGDIYKQIMLIPNDVNFVEYL